MADEVKANIAAKTVENDMTKTDIARVTENNIQAGGHRDDQEEREHIFSPESIVGNYWN